jgi:FlaA1/EpsC-like NDP-sugar epimerase
MTIYGTTINIESVFRKNFIKNVAKILINVYRLIFIKMERFNMSGMDYVPRWVILTIDMSIVSLSGLFTFFLLESSGAHYINGSSFFLASLIYLTTHLLFFRVFEIYSGIVRHSSMIDVMKIFLAQFFSFLVLVLINSLLVFKTHEKLYLTAGLLINNLFTGVSLFSYRIVIKHIFINYVGVRRKRELSNAIIVGTNSNAISMANALNADNPRKFRVVGFLDKSENSTSKKILNQPIFCLSDSFELMVKDRNVHSIIISDETINQKEKEDIIEKALREELDVYKVSMISNWSNQKQISSSVKKYKIEDLLERNPIVMDNSSLSEDLEGKTIMVTGAAGSIGSEIVRQVLKFKPREVVLVDQAETPLHSLSLEVLETHPDADVVTIMADIRNKDVMRSIFSQYKPDMVYHAAAYKHVPMMENNPSQAIFTNIMGTKNLADLSVEFEVKKFVMVSTDKAVNPSNVMGASKRIAEKYVQSLHNQLLRSNRLKTRFITTRFGNVLGSNGSVVPLFTKQIEQGGPITITHPDIIRYFMTIPEACQLVLEAGTMGNGGEIFIFDMGKPVKILDLANKMIKLAGLTPEKDIKVQFTGLRPGEKLYEELLNDTSETLPTYHEKITIFQDQIEDFNYINGNIHELINLGNSYSNNDMVRKMKAILPEFKSMNSTFQKIDEVALKQAS